LGTKIIIFYDTAWGRPPYWFDCRQNCLYPRQTTANNCKTAFSLHLQLLVYYVANIAGPLRVSEALNTADDDDDDDDDNR